MTDTDGLGDIDGLGQYKLLSFVHNSVLTGFEINYTVSDFLCPWRVVPHRLQCYSKFYTKVVLDFFFRNG